MLLNLKKNKIGFLCWIVLISNSTLASTTNKRLTDHIISPVNFFVDREEERSAMLHNLQTYKIASIVGVTSIGKTEIIRKYVFLNQKNYDLIWFFDSGLDLNEQFTALAKKINQTLLPADSNKISEVAYNSRQEVMKYLSERQNWLLVFDNLRLNQNTKISDIVNWEHNGHIIICSQDSKDLPNVIYVHKLDRDNALILLQKIFSKNEKNKIMFEELVEIFDGYPAPIVRGALLLKENNYLSLDEYKNILAKSSDTIQSHMELVLKLLKDSDKKLLKYIAILNNQSFSKSLLKMISDNPKEVGESLYNLNRFGLIKNTDNNDQGNFFEMHDVVRNSVLKLSGLGEIRQELGGVINKLNALMPQGVTSKYAFITRDSTIKSNLEVLLNNAEKYNVDIYQILELRKNLINYYVASLDYHNVEKMKTWLEQRELEHSLMLSNMNNHTKTHYSWYLVDIGIYEDFYKSSFMSALSYFNKAKDIMKEIQDQPELKSTILFQIAQTQIYAGDAKSAEQNIMEVDNLIRKYPIADFDMGLYWFIKARVALTKGDYEEALVAIDNNIKAESHLPQDTFTAPTYILKSEILNFMGEYNQSYEIITRIQKQEISNNYAEHEIHARILTQLSGAELGLGLTDLSLAHAVIACNIYQKIIDEYDVAINTAFAASLVAKGDALYKQNKFEEALNVYNEAESIYFKKYEGNYHHMDDISYLLLQGTKAACSIKHSFWKKHFYDQLIASFDQNHARVKEAIEFCNKLRF